MIDINDQRNQHLLAHPHFLSGVAHEQERIIAALNDGHTCTTPEPDTCAVCWAIEKAKGD